jgi:hypothetical protein
VKLTDAHGVEHSVKVRAESVYEAALTARRWRRLFGNCRRAVSSKERTDPIYVIVCLPEERRIMANVVEILQAEKKALQNRLAALETAIRALNGAVLRSTVAKTVKRATRKGKKMSAATRAKIAKAASERWAKIKKG